MSVEPELQDIIAFLDQVQIEKDEVDGEALKSATPELEEYRQAHARRFWRSLALIKKWAPPDRPVRILELGSAPYYFTLLLHRALPCQIVGVNVEAGVWPGATTSAPGPKTVRLRWGNEAASLDLEIHVLNIEKDPFPFANDSFDMVLCMEVIEHLTYSPTHMLTETHRVLRQGGRLVLSTPNSISMKKTVALLCNRSMEFPYSGYGIYGRHQREFTVQELRTLLEACHFHVLEADLENIFLRSHLPTAKRLAFGVLNFLSSLPLPYLRAKQEYILMVAESFDAPRAAYPEHLYIHRHLYPAKEGREAK
jgi:SAM-dependent methyltransferase